jgi:hypothetical protein
VGTRERIFLGAIVALVAVMLWLGLDSNGFADELRWIRWLFSGA